MEEGAPSVMKNCEPLLLGPELAMARIPAPVNRRSGCCKGRRQRAAPLRERGWAAHNLVLELVAVDRDTASAGALRERGSLRG